MSEQDEYDAYFVPFTLDCEDLDAIQAAEARALSRNHVKEHTSDSLPHKPPPPHTPPSPDEFDAYDLPELSAEDFEQIDKLALPIRPSPPPPALDKPEGTAPLEGRSPLGGGSPTRGDGGVKNGGPSIEIALEPAGNANPPRRLKDSWIKRTRRSPYEQFRRWNGLLSVTDITGPSWCEVQFDYGLRQKRYKKLADRPTSFVTAEGKTIAVAHQVAAVNERTVIRGRSVHKVLEREIQPEAVQIEITTNEERWALRLVNMLTSLHTMTGLGRCREMPVFGVVHDQIVTGIIDEIVRQPLPAPLVSKDSRSRKASKSPNKRPPPHSTPSSPTAPNPKKICPESPADQRQITSFFTPTGVQGDTAQTAIDVDSEEPTTPAPSQRGLPEEADSTLAPHALRYSLHLSDTKTRIRPTLPAEEDSFAGRVQLMLYHRLLSNLLSPAQRDIASSQPLDFEAFWQKANVDPARKFSDSFLLQTGLPIARQSNQEGTSTASAIDLSGIHCLNDLTQAWHRAVEALNAVRVDNTLTIVYRAQPTRASAPTTGSGKGKDKEKTPEPAATTSTRSSSTLSLSDQEARDIAAAIQASISDIQPGTGGDDDLARAIFESLRDAIRSGQTSEGELGILTHPFGPPISDTMRTLEGEGGLHTGASASASGDTSTPAAAHVAADGLAEDPQLAWALQQSLLARLEETPALKEAIAEAVVSSGADAPAADRDEVVDGPQEESGEPGAGVGTLLSRSATEEPEGVAKTAPSSPPAPQAEEDEDEEMITAADLETEAKIIGTKEFELDEKLLDDYLESVLAWWYGKRPPQGVDVELTRRCLTCEYRDGCEWREKKAQEALQKYRAESPSSAAAEWL